MRGIDGGEHNGMTVRVWILDQQDRCRALAYEFPIGQAQQPGRRMPTRMPGRNDEVGLATERLANDGFVARKIPFSFHGHPDAVFAQLLGNDLESGQSALSQIMLNALEALIGEPGYV